MLPLDTYHLVGHRLVNYERGFDLPELLLWWEECYGIFGLQHMRRVGRPNQYLKTAIPGGASGRGRVLLRTLQNIAKEYKVPLALGVGISVT